MITVVFNDLFFITQTIQQEESAQSIKRTHVRTNERTNTRTQAQTNERTNEQAFEPSLPGSQLPIFSLTVFVSEYCCKPYSPLQEIKECASNKL